MTQIYSASATTPTATARIPVQNTLGESAQRWTGQQIADLLIYFGLTVNALGSINSNTDIDFGDGRVVTATIAGNLTFTFSNPPATGGFEALLFLTNGGAHTITWPAALSWSGGTAPTLRSSGLDLVRIYTNDGGTTWFGTLDFTDAVRPARTISTQHSLTGGGDLSADRTLALVGDVASPGASKVYGTDGSGVRGWYDAPSGASPGGSGSEIQYRGGASTFSAASGTHWDATNGRLSIGAGTSPGAVVHAQCDSASEIVGILQGAASQTANLQEWKNSAGTILNYVAAGGQIRLAHYGSAAAPALAFDISGNTGYGLWYSGGELKFSVNGSEVASFGNSGLTSTSLVGRATAGGSAYGFKRHHYILSSSTTLTSWYYNGTTITNGYASSAITSTLVTAAQGYTHRFVDTNSTHRWTIKPNTGDTILWPDGTVVTATGSIVSTAQYDSVDVEALDATTWLASNVRGTWTVTA